jgi:hypothetical protein
MRRWLISSVGVVLALALWGGCAEAARNFVGTQTPAPNAPVTMGTAGTLTYRIANANTGGNTGERIYEVRFRMSGGRSTFSATTAAPAGWTRTAYSTTSVTFRANSWANAIATGSYLDFPVAFNFRQTTADTTERLRDIRARFTTSTGGPPFTDLGSDTDSNQGGWTLRSLSITSFQTTDLSGTPVSAVAYGTPFRLVMTIRNNSTATQSAIVSNPNPPGLVGGSVSPGLPSSTVYSPSPLNLAPGASGTITFTYTAPATSGSIQFTAAARNGANTATSLTAFSNVLTVSPLTVSIAVTPSCLFTGATATFTMTVTNSTGSSVTDVTPSALTRVTVNGASIGAFTGPSPASIASLANGASGTFTWTAVVTGTVSASGPKPSFYVTGSATANDGVIVTPVATSNQEDIDEYSVSVAPSNTNASSTNEELIWTINNRGCAAVDSVSISIDPDWTYANDAYSEVDLSAVSTVETWSTGAPNPVVFTAAPTVAERLPLDFTGDFRLVFSALPVVPETSNFTVTVTDAAVPPNTRTIVTSVQVISFDPAGPNAAGTRIWQEQVR